MKKLNLVGIVLLTTFLVLGCVAKYSIPTGATNDLTFVGKWKGEHFNEKGKYWRKWTQQRNEDGTYKLTLKYYNDSNNYLETQIEKGYWWVQNGLFHEINPSRMSKPETYKFEFVSNEEIKFTSTVIDSSSDEKTGYSFTDTKVD